MRTPLSQMTYDQIDELMQESARAVNAVVRFHTGEGPLFALLVFDDTKRPQYISSRTRASMIRALRETVNRLEVDETGHRPERI